MVPSYSLPYIVAFLLASFSLIFNWNRRPSCPKNAPKLTSDSWPILGSLSFFTKRCSFLSPPPHTCIFECNSWLITPTGDFYYRATRQFRTKTENFSFYVGNYLVVALSGEEQRKTFFEHGGLACSEGYSTLLAGAPQVKENNNVLAKNNAGNSGFTYYFQKRLVRMLKGEQLKKVLPQLLRDARANVDAIAAHPSGITNPFDSIYQIVFHVTVRTVACNEIADDPKLRERFLALFETIEGTGTPMSIIFPWLPTPAKISRAYAGVQLYRIVKKVIDERTSSGRRDDDALQFLMDQGDTVLNIISVSSISTKSKIGIREETANERKFVLGALFAGQLNSGINIAFIICYLAQEQDWLKRVREELNTVIDQYSPNRSVPLKDRLMDIPIDAWEGKFPIIDLCLKETIRLQMSGSAFRFNISGNDIPIGKAGTEVIPKGAYVTLAAGDMHYNPEIYTNPEEWDPARYLLGREEDKKQVYSWMGWGLARHPCLGTRFAKLETNVIVAFFLAHFEDIQLCDKAGNLFDRVPPCNRNNYTPRKPDQDVCLKVKSRISR